MPNGVSSKQKREEQRHKRRLQAERAVALAGKMPVRLVKVPSAAPSLPAHKYPAKRVAAGKRQSVAPIGRGDK